MSCRRQSGIPAALILSAVSFYYVARVMWARALLGAGMPAFDIYNQVLPNMIYAQRSFERGYGLLWNSLQNCGQPFFALVHSGLLYPLNALFLFFEPNLTFLLVAAIHLAIGGITMHLLCRQVGTGRSAGLCGALTFQLGGVMLHLASWLPTNVLGSYVWVPAAVLLTERIIVRPGYPTAVCLGGVLALQFLAGFPQTSVFTYQIIVARLLWESVTGQHYYVLRALGPIVLGLTLGVCLAAVQFLPSVEMARISLRAKPLSFSDQNPQVMTWKGFRDNVDRRETGPGNLFAVAPVALAAFAFRRREQRRVALFYLLLGATFLSLAFAIPLLRSQVQLPGMSIFRLPQRTLWVTAFALGPLVGLGADSLLRGNGGGPWSALATISIFILGTTGFWLLSPSGLRSWEWLLVVLLGCTVAIAYRGGKFIAIALPVLVFWNLLGVGSRPFQSHLENLSTYYRHAGAFALVAQRLTLQDRVDVLGEHADFSLMPKSATVYGIPAIRDYEPLTSMRYAEFSFALRRSEIAISRLRAREEILHSISEYTFFAHVLPANRPLLDLLAVKYLIVDARKDDSRLRIRPRLKLIRNYAGVRVYENEQALARAFYVPRAEVVDDSKALLQRLASENHWPQRVALIEEVPPDGFLGLSARGTGAVEMLADRGEELVIRVTASQEGFLFVSDQYYPGWEATVNGFRQPVYRANYAFRLVRVPQGQSMVVFRYRPKSIRIGALISGVSVAALLLFWTGSRQLRKGTLQ